MMQTTDAEADEHHHHSALVSTLAVKGGASHKSHENAGVAAKRTLKASEKQSKVKVLQNNSCVENKEVSAEKSSPASSKGSAAKTS
mmetsp:Transcript_5447/g.7280  ORF Transcript_5447/g.7280 Transcript_5447/m.7280 type:complete len:86 (-) Transcript_5447:222-479(-)|eukprot:CAMPEP_0185593946 /NCGR_PEP_ID=MMETSP0434-20130131/73165_1 /TAXON_ID=626734 ORGANISM="Favella taraikaensis, Strain Fe Narragansett Bay" /NCGR_SAMPLE_ID=MMETSP0434 /ASSEMBLY_ACC=CAM_ASM_000379 /LENGTH=85 /DNA_ID=CAMNT_0028220913 /DNA_START=622 /DNA_END=879 /DNA_ORIENTATION=-